MKKILAALVFMIAVTVAVFGYYRYMQGVQQGRDADKARQAIREVLKDHPDFDNPCFGSSVLTTDGEAHDDVVKGKSVEEIKAYIIQEESGGSSC